MFDYGPKNEKSIYVQGMCVTANIYFLICKHQKTITKECIFWTSLVMTVKLCLSRKVIIEIALGLFEDGELEDFDIAVIQWRIDKELSTEILSTGTQCHVFRCPGKSSIK